MKTYYIVMRYEEDWGHDRPFAVYETRDEAEQCISDGAQLVADLANESRRRLFELGRSVGRAVTAEELCPTFRIEEIHDPRSSA